MNDHEIDANRVVREQVSALADGQLTGEAFSSAVDSVIDSTDAGAAWYSYHVIGDVLRSADGPLALGNAGFALRLSARLSNEPRLLAVHSVPPTVVQVDAAMPSGRAWTDAARNDARYRWRVAAMVAGVAVTALLGWALLPALHGSDGVAQLARASGASIPASEVVVAVTPSAEPQVMMRDARLDELLAAHQQIGGMSALQNPSGFLRNATFEQHAR